MKDYRTGGIKDGITRFFNPKKIKDWYLNKRFHPARQLEEGYIHWGLGIEAPFFLSDKFSVENNSVAIVGSQSTHNHSWPIKYSIVKISKLGTMVKYLNSVIIYGDHVDEEFHHIFHLANGSDYQLLIFNNYHYHSIGRVRFIQD
ncbi:hypothetical protein [Neobacillus niacini]|uniref:hypothetical protein n=1 Tax=Neobacillus niacini TaxID=86668 RepID=UPI0021CB4666|nr:hypothetical protein [Neobacillus niacini]MCM3764896.1 hypothetical protein [Neobacillus niacini]